MIQTGTPIKLKIGGYKIPVTFTEVTGGRLEVHAPYNKTLISEIRAMEGAKWHGFDEKNPRKIWTIDKSQRNEFQIRYLMGEDVYKVYDKELVTVTTKRPLYQHQLLQKSFILTRHYVLLAAEMGTGKSLSAIEAAECSCAKDIWYVGPKSGVTAFKRELSKWDSKIKPTMHTYEGLVKVVAGWPSGMPAPQFVIFDESSKLKNPMSQRSKAAKWVADAVRAEHGDAGYVVEMTGTPAPRSPEDWWHQCEVACPGYLREGSVAKFRARMCLIKNQASLTGGTFPKLITWYDNELKCKDCGLFQEDLIHDQMSPGFHFFKKSTNEVAYLYERLKGLVLIQFKKDCVDLPEITYDVLECTPTPDMLRAAKMIRTRCRRAVTALNLLRELSDGFQYTNVDTGENEVCVKCGGSGKAMVPSVGEVDTTLPFEAQADIVMTEADCPNCGGVGTTDVIVRGQIYVGSPKEDAFISQLDELEDVGRALVWGGYTATIDRLVEIAKQYGWATLRIDGRGYQAIDAFGNPANKDDYLTAMDRSHKRYNELYVSIPKLCVVGQPQSGGMALTFTAAPINIFYSNTFDGESRMQAIHRFHRLGMDTNSGAIVRDIVCLPSDVMVRDNLQKKVTLQSITMGEIEKGFRDAGIE